MIALDVEFFEEKHVRVPRVVAIANAWQRTTFVACLTGERSRNACAREIEAAARQPGVCFMGVGVAEDLKVLGVHTIAAPCFDLNQWFADALGYKPLSGSLGIGYILHAIMQEDKIMIERIKNHMRTQSMWHTDSPLTSKHIAYAALDVLVTIFLLQHHQPRTLARSLYRSPGPQDLQVPDSVLHHIRSSLQTFLKKSTNVLINTKTINNHHEKSSLDSMLLRFAYDTKVTNRIPIFFIPVC